MYLIEWLFHMAPDDGSGTLEAALMLVGFLVPVGMAMVRRLRRARLAGDLQDKL